MSNPYHPGRPVDGGEGFFGRFGEVRNALSLLANVQCVSIVGPRRIGKTSFLHYIADPSVLREHTSDAGQFAFVFVGCAELSDLTRDRILEVMLDRARTSAQQAGLNIGTRVSLAAGMSFIDFSNALAEFTRSGVKLVFLLDEFEFLAKNSSLDPALFAGLRSVATNLSVAYVTASCDSLLDLTFANSQVLGSPFFNIFSTIRLGLFEDSAARELIHKPSSAAGVTFSDATVEQIVSLADHHPFFIQIACFQAFEMQSKMQDLIAADYASLRERVEEDLRDHFRSAWGHLKPEERRALLSLSTTPAVPADQGGLDALRDQCLVRREEERWNLLCRPWADFVRKQANQSIAEAPRMEEAAEVKRTEPPSSATTCTVSIHLNSDRQITVEVEGAARYVPNESSTWDATDEDFALLKLAVNQLYNETGEQWKIKARTIGEKLYDDIIGSRLEIRDAFSLGVGDRRPKDMRIRFKVPREYLALPLELLHDGRDWLAMKHPVAKFITGEKIRRPLLAEKLHRGEELRVLLVGSNVCGEIYINNERYTLDSLDQVNYEIEEISALLRGAASDMGVQFRAQILCDERANYHDLCRELKMGGYDLFHYSGHASYNGARPDGSALFVRESVGNGSPKAMTAGELKSLLENSNLRFAYFSCCTGATQSSDGDLRRHDFLGIVDAAVQAGLPAVLGLRWPVGDRSARQLAYAFYAALLPTGELDSALLAARQSIGRDDITWVSPVLVVQA